jgi:hypothetical protein
MHWCFGLKIREQFTVSAFSLTVWQTSLHILINVYWNKYGLIQTDTTNDIVVYSFLAWLIAESIPYIYLFNAAKFTYQLPYDQNNQDNSFNFRFQIGNGRQSKRLRAYLGRILLFHYLFFWIKTWIQDFLPDIYSAYKNLYEKPL